jgi:hypothetical protein
MQSSNNAEVDRGERLHGRLARKCYQHAYLIDYNAQRRFSMSYVSKRCSSPLFLPSLHFDISLSRTSKQASRQAQHDVQNYSSLSVLPFSFMPSEVPVHPAEHHLVPFHPFLPLPFQLLVHLVLSFLPCYLLAVPVPVAE